MNTENTIAIKKVLEQAAGNPAQAESDGWTAEGMERLYFEASGIYQSGFVEIRHGQRNSDYVRMELQVTPDVAAKVIALITGTTLGEIPDLSEPEPIYEEPSSFMELIAADIVCGTFVGVSAQIASEQPKTLEQTQADNRNAEIARLIREQRKEEEMEREEKSEPVEEVEELDFDLPADKDR